MTSYDCSVCGSPLESSIHDTNSQNTEIRMAAHKFVPDDYVAWCRYTDNGPIVTCDSDAPGAFRVYRRAPEPQKGGRP